MSSNIVIIHGHFKPLNAETAGLLPARFLKQEDGGWDVRDNLFAHKKALQMNPPQDLDSDYQSDQPYSGGSTQESTE